MKHFILLSVTVPHPAEREKTAQWEKLQLHLEPLSRQTKGIVPLASNVWLLPRDQGMPFVAECMAVASRSNLQAQPIFLTADD